VRGHRQYDRVDEAEARLIARYGTWRGSFDPLRREATSSIVRSAAQNDASPAMARFTHRNSLGVGGIMSRHTRAVARKNAARRPILT
jgi:hypothetical protein